jgi:hypothetical protein
MSQVCVCICIVSDYILSDYIVSDYIVCMYVCRLLELEAVLSNDESGMYMYIYYILYTIYYILYTIYYTLYLFIYTLYSLYIPYTLCIYLLYIIYVYLLSMLELEAVLSNDESGMYVYIYSIRLYSIRL